MTYFMELYVCFIIFKYGCLLISVVCFREPLITNIMWRNLLIQVISCGLISVFSKFPFSKALALYKIPYSMVYLQAFYQVTVLLVLNFRGRSLLHLNHSNLEAIKVKNTLIFNAFVLCQVSPLLK